MNAVKNTHGDDGFAESDACVSVMYLHDHIETSKIRKLAAESSSECVA
jgi:hypothetical protein